MESALAGYENVVGSLGYVNFQKSPKAKDKDVETRQNQYAVPNLTTNQVYGIGSVTVNQTPTEDDHYMTVCDDGKMAATNV